MARRQVPLRGGNVRAWISFMPWQSYSPDARNRIQPSTNRGCFGDDRSGGMLAESVSPLMMPRCDADIRNASRINEHKSGAETSGLQRPDAWPASRMIDVQRVDLFELRPAQRTTRLHPFDLLSQFVAHSHVENFLESFSRRSCNCVAESGGSHDRTGQRPPCRLHPRRNELNPWSKVRFQNEEDCAVAGPRLDLSPPIANLFGQLMSTLARVGSEPLRGDPGLGDRTRAIDKPLADSGMICRVVARVSHYG